jgi:hypothetical protein
MRTPLTLLTLSLTLTLGACEYYECGPGCGECDPWEEDCDDRGPWDDDPWGEDADADADADADTDTDTDTDTDVVEPPPRDISFELTPAEAEQGDVFIGSLSMGGEDAPGYEAITDVTFYGDVNILAVDQRSYEILVSVQVAQDGEGPVDLLVELEDGSAVWAEDILTIFPDGSGHEASGSGDPDPCE